MRKMLRRLAVLALVAPLSCLVLPAFGQDFEEEEPEEVMGEEELVEPIEEAGDEETGDDVFLDLEGEEEEPTPEEIAEDFETDKALEAVSYTHLRAHET